LSVTVVEQDAPEEKQKAESGDEILDARAAQIRNEK